MKYYTTYEFMSKLNIRDTKLLEDMESKGFLRPANQTYAGTKYYSKEQIKNFDYIYSLYVDFCRKHSKPNNTQLNKSPNPVVNMLPVRDMQFLQNNNLETPITQQEHNVQTPIQYHYQTNIIEPTCVTEGYTEHICLENPQDTYVDNQIPALGHEYTSKIIKKVTCEKDGLIEYSCIRCKNKYKEPIPALQHEFADFIKQEQTCEQEGIIEHKCTKCGKTSIEKLPATGHDFETEIVQEGSCTEDKIIKSTCKKCGKIDIKTIAAQGHKYIKNVKLNPTCEKDGLIEYTCEICGDSYTENIASLGHSYTDTIIKPSCTEKGKTIHKCIRCGKSYEDTITDIIPHDFNINVIEPTCINPGKTVYTCKRCGLTKEDNITEALGHDYISSVIKEPGEYDEGIKEFKCTRCGDTYTEEIPSLSYEISQKNVDNLLDQLSSLQEENETIINEKLIESEKRQKELEEKFKNPVIVQGKKRDFKKLNIPN